MAAAKPRPVAESAVALAGSLARTQRLLPHADAVTPAMISAGGTPDSTPPWNAQAAHALLDAHAGIRHLEQGLRLAVTGTRRPRGGSNRNTARSLEAVVRLADAVGRHDSACKDNSCDECRIIRLLERWSGGCLALPAIDEIIRWQPIRGGPRRACPDCEDAKACDEHRRPPACPYCNLFSLRYAPDRYLVACFNHECKDAEENPPLASMYPDRATGDPYLLWRDGRVQAAA